MYKSVKSYLAMNIDTFLGVKYVAHNNQVPKM